MSKTVYRFHIEENTHLLEIDAERKAVSKLAMAHKQTTDGVFDISSFCEFLDDVGVDYRKPPVIDVINIT